MRRDPRANNFDALRIAAALLVVAGHAYILSGRSAAEPLAAHSGVSLGEVGVSIFFVISGFLVTLSFDRLRAVGPYLKNRCLRILPGLGVALVLTALALGPLVSEAPPQTYFAQPQTWLYVLRNLLLYPVDYRLPGVFQHVPYPGAVNGSLWTLRLEFSFYLVVPLMARLGLLTRPGLAGLAAAAALAFAGALALGPHVPAVALLAARNFYLFAAGAALFAWRDARWVRSATVLVLALAWIVAALVARGLAPAALYWALPLGVVGVALRPIPGLVQAARFGDLSYGTYIYAFPVQQALMQALGPARLGVGGFFLLTVVCVAPLALLSWWGVERPALRLKRGPGRAVTAAPEPAQARAGTRGSPPRSGGEAARAVRPG